MREATSKIEKRVASAAVRAASRPVVNAARAAVPRDTGQLRKSIGVKVKRYKGAVWAGIGPRSGFKITASDGRPRNPTQYAHLIERGTRKQRARPFLRPAIDGTRTEQLQAFANKASETFDKLDLSK
jgi:HK97 gp10 family phage protein